MCEGLGPRKGWAVVVAFVLNWVLDDVYVYVGVYAISLLLACGTVWDQCTWSVIEA